MAFLGEPANAKTVMDAAFLTVSVSAMKIMTDPYAN